MDNAKLEEKRKELYKRVVLALRNQKLGQELERSSLESAEISFKNIPELKIDKTIKTIDSILKIFEEDETKGLSEVLRNGILAKELQLVIMMIKEGMQEKFDKLSSEEKDKIIADML